MFIITPTMHMGPGQVHCPMTLTYCSSLYFIFFHTARYFILTAPHHWCSKILETLPDVENHNNYASTK